MEWISREECVRVYKVDIAFFNDLVEAGLIETIVRKDTLYLPYDKLAHFEKLVTWHYDLEINIPGMEVICQLLEKMERLRTLPFN